MQIIEIFTYVETRAADRTLIKLKPFFLLSPSFINVLPPKLICIR